MKEAITRREKSAARRQEIIQAGLTCFTERGFTDTSMAEIRRRSRASTGSIYHHFKSKEQLAAAIYLEGIRDYQTGFLAALEKQMGAREGIFAVIRYHLRWVEKHPDWTRFLFRQRHAEFMAETDEEFARLNRIFYQRSGDWFRPHVKAGTLRRLPSDLYSSLLLGPCMEFTRQYLAGHTRTPPGQAIRALASAAWRCLNSETAG